MDGPKQEKSSFSFLETNSDLKTSCHVYTNANCDLVLLRTGFKQQFHRYEKKRGFHCHL